MYILCCTIIHVHTVHMYCTHRLIHVHTVYWNVYVMFILTILHNVCHVYVCLLYSTYSMCNTTYTHILPIQYLQHGTARHGTYTHSTASYTEYDSYSSHITVLYHTMNMCVLAEFSKQKSHSMFML